MFDHALLARIEDAGLNASAPQAQRWQDGWLLRYSPGKIKRARCVNALAAGCTSLQAKLQRAAALYAQHGLPLLLRITPFSQPSHLDAVLAELGFARFDDVRVMVSTGLPSAHQLALPAGAHWVALDGPGFVQAIADARKWSPAQRVAEAQRMTQSPVPYQGMALRRDQDQTLLCCGQMTVEDDLVGLYSIYTSPEYRRQGLAQQLCKHLLFLAAKQGARCAYLQVEADNDVARRVYGHLGFVDAYGYHYRQAPTDAA